MKIKKSSNESSDIDRDMITVNNIFGHLIKEISITKYGSDNNLIPIFSPYEIYPYSDAILNHLPKDSLKKLKKQSFIANKAFILTKERQTEEFTMELVLQKQMIQKI